MAILEEAIFTIYNKRIWEIVKQQLPGGLTFSEKPGALVSTSIKNELSKLLLAPQRVNYLEPQIELAVNQFF